MTKSAIRNCPICSVNKVEVLHTQNFKLNNKSVLPLSYDVVSCSNCGFCYADSSANQEIYNKYYAEFSKYEDQNTSVSSGGGNSVWDKKRLENTAKDIEKNCDKNAKIIDIGCANGGLLKELKSIGFKNLFGLDPSKSCVNYVNSLGIKCYLGELFTSEVTLKNEKFDFIILSHVLEHICDLKNAVIALKKILNPNGKIYIEVPDASNYSNYFIVPYYYFDTEHINHLDKFSLKNLFESNGLTEVEAENKAFKVNDDTLYPATYSIFQKTEVVKEVIPSFVVKEQIVKFLSQSKEKNSDTIINNLIGNKTEIVVFGAGNFTARLLEDTKLGECNIVAFVDNDANKQGNDFNNKKVFSPEYLKTFSGTIVICSAIYSSQIKKQIQEEMHLKNEIIILN